jgi:uncharacterized membrane protein
VWDGYNNKANFFWVNFILLSAAALLLVFFLKWLNGIFKEYVDRPAIGDEDLSLKDDEALIDQL